jgi:YidC/Oxa1 family membrane protein insertase
LEFFSNLLSPIESLLQFVLGGLYNVNSMFGLVSYGYAIILLTIIVKFLLYPLTVKQVKSMKAMQEIAPKMKKIQEKYKDNPQVMQQKVAALYQEAGVNPLAGCLPLLVQMPILMGMYYSLYNLEYPSADAAQFLWLPSLSEADPYYILPILNVLTTFYQTRQTSDMSNPQMKMMMLIMPLFIGFISLTFPSGLVLYWVVMNICQILQQWWIYREGGPAEQAKAAVRSKEEG